MNDEQHDKPQEEPDFDAARAEIAAMGKAYEALHALSRAGQVRALSWLEDRLDADFRATRPAQADDERPF